MRLECTVNSQLPKLAWAATVNIGGGKVAVQHGSHVESRDGFFVEGVWDGDFSHGGFDATDTFFGSGGIIAEDSVIFPACTATTDAIFYAEQVDGAVVSNSLPFLLSLVGHELDTSNRDYHRIAESPIKGLREYDRRIPTKSGSVQRLFHHNLVVSSQGVSVADKALPPSFENFGAYASYIEAKVAAIARNARDSGRRHKLQIFSTQSRGFDTTAVNSITCRHGVDKVFTIRTANVRGYFASNEPIHLQPNDDGTEICACLGLPCVAIDRRAFVRAFNDEYLYYCAYPTSQDANMLEIHNHVDGAAVLFTGQLGEVWRSKISSRFLNPDLVRMDAAGQGLSEVRLKSGIIQLPLPFIGARRWTDIHTISNSEAMRVYRSPDPDYDKPIARRLGVDGGVPETLFGQAKMASTVSFVIPTLPHSMVLKDAYLDFIVEQRVLRRWQRRLLPLVRRINGVILKSSPNHYVWLYYVERLISKLRRRDFTFKGIWVDMNSALMCFSVNRRISDYSVMLGTGGDDIPTPRVVRDTL